MTWNDIANLVERAQAGDREAYGELVKQFEPTVYAVALGKLRNPAEAQELVQEVFIHSMTKLDQLRNVHCFAGWLKQITVRMAINRLTRRGPVHGTDTEFLERTPGQDVGPLEEMVRAEEHAEVWNGLDRLKPVDRATLVAFYIRGHSLREMSQEFETPIGTIKRRLHVARNRLRRQLEGRAEPAPAGPRPRKPRRRREPVCV